MFDYFNIVSRAGTYFLVILYHKGMNHLLTHIDHSTKSLDINIFVEVVYIEFHLCKILEGISYLLKHKIAHSIGYHLDKNTDSIHIDIHQITPKANIYHKDLDKHIMYHYTMNQEDKKVRHKFDHSIFCWMDKLDHHIFVEKLKIPNLRDKRIDYLMGYKFGCLHILKLRHILFHYTIVQKGIYKPNPDYPKLAHLCKLELAAHNIHLQELYLLSKYKFWSHYPIFAHLCKDLLNNKYHSIQ